MSCSAADFIKAGADGVGVGSALVNKTYVENGEFDKLTELATRFVKNVKIFFIDLVGKIFIF